MRMLLEEFDGEVPGRLEELIRLPGVARKTANVVLNNAFDIPSGVIVDTHVARVSQRLGLSERPKPERIEQDLMRLIPQDEWIHFGPALVLHGRYTCTAHDPKCSECLLNDLCPKRGVLPFEPETPEWVAWVAEQDSFRFVGRAGHFTAHHEWRVPKGAWRAHRHIRNHNYIQRLAPNHQLTSAVLEQAAEALQAHLT